MPEQSFDPVLMIRELLQRVAELERRLQELEQAPQIDVPTAAPAKPRARTGTRF